ncbi:MAG: hypothetical protein NVSMB52_07020 [Chloroflexota bacterium]
MGRLPSMRSLLWSLILAVAFALVPSWALGADSWLMSGHDAAQTNANPGTGALGLAAAVTLHPVWIYPDVVQAIATDKKVFAALTEHPPSSAARLVVVMLNARSGGLMRKFTTESLGVRSSTYTASLAYGAGRLVVAMDPAVVALNPDTGRHYWRNADGASLVTLDRDTLYTGKGCQYACGGVLTSNAISLRTGKVLWRHPGNLGGVPTLVAGRLYQNWGLSDVTAETHVYEPYSGQIVGRLPWNAVWTGDRKHAYADVVGGNTSPTGRTWLGQIGPVGKPIWKLDTGHANYTPPVLADHTLFCASNRFHPGLIAVNPANGHLMWASDLGGNLSVTAANHLLFVLHRVTGQVDVVRAITGRIVRTLHLPKAAGSGASDIFVSDSTLYVVAQKGLVAFRP